MLTQLAAISLVALLLVVVPVMSFLTARKLKRQQVPRLDLYVSAAFSQWLLAVVGVAVVLISGLDLSALGFRFIPLGTLAPWVLLLVVVALAAVGLELVLGRFGWWPQESELVLLLIPETPREKLWAVFGLAPTAALCEEFLYRGFLLAQFSQWIEHGPWAWILSSVAFGLAHVYQGLAGAARAILLGALLAYPVMQLGSLWPSIAAHLVIDAVAFGWLGPAFVRRTRAEAAGAKEPGAADEGGENPLG